VLNDGKLSLGMNIGNNTELIWRVCRRVSIDGDILRWELGQKCYGLLQAYEDAPHRDLMTADSDDKLRVFVRKWGPLRRLSDGQDSLTWYRQKRDVLIETMRLIDAVESGNEIRNVVRRLIEVSDEIDPIHIYLRIFPPQCQRREDMTKWCDSVTGRELDNSVVAFLNNFSVAMPRYVVDKSRRRTVVRTSIFVNGLLEAIWWMVWQDRFRQEPFYFCQECGRFFQPEDRHRTKFHDGTCAKRRADRDSWRRRKGKGLRYKGRTK
jgi:hypothetical protein